MADRANQQAILLVRGCAKELGNSGGALTLGGLWDPSLAITTLARMSRDSV